MKEHHLGIVREAVALLERKASAEELEDYRRFTLDLAERVARAKEESDQPVSDAERAAIDETPWRSAKYSAERSSGHDRQGSR